MERWSLNNKLSFFQWQHAGTQQSWIRGFIHGFIHSVIDPVPRGCSFLTEGERPSIINSSNSSSSSNKAGVMKMREHASSTCP